MATEKDQALVQFLLRGTQGGRVKWEPTAVQEQYATSFKGKYTVTVDRGEQRSGEPYFFLTLKDSDDRQLLELNDSQCRDVATLFFRAARASLNVDAAIDEIIGEDADAPPAIDDKDIPF
jgi:hypothetical protein